MRALEVTEKLIELLEKLPHTLEADWEGTNHYELQNRWQDNEEWSKEYFYLCLDGCGFNDKTEDGKRMGLILDLIAELSKIKRIQMGMESES